MCLSNLAFTIVLNILISETLHLRDYELFCVVCTTMMLLVAFFFRVVYAVLFPRHPSPSEQRSGPVTKYFEGTVAAVSTIHVALHSILLYSSSHHCEEYDKRRYDIQQELSCTSTISWLLIMVFLSPLVLEKPRFALLISCQVASYLLFNVLFGFIMQTPQYTLHVGTMGCVVFCALLKVHQESRHRDQFEALVVVCIEVHRLSERREKLNS